MTAKNITRLLAVALIACLPLLASADEGSRALPGSSISSVVKSYISAEEKQDYAHVYLLLSRGKKEQLRREYTVMGAKDYTKLRQSSEARWFGFSETKRNIAAKEATVMFNVTIEESGEKERVPLTIRLVIQDGYWRIDDIKY